MEKVCGIYCIENKINHKKYIGQSVDIKERWRHERQNKKNNKHFTRAINKYGIDNFLFTILEECSPQELDDKEQLYIKKFNSDNQKFGYNMETGGKNYSTWFVKLSEEERKEINKKRSLTQKGKSKNWSQGGKERIAKANLDRLRRYKKLKSVYCLETDTIYESISEAAKKNGINDSVLVSRCCNKKMNTTNGLHFCFANEKDTIIWDTKTLREKYTEKFGKKIKCITLGLEFPSINKAVEELRKLNYKVNKKGISRVCQNKQKICGGLTFKEIKE